MPATRKIDSLPAVRSAPPYGHTEAASIAPFILRQGTLFRSKDFTLRITSCKGLCFQNFDASEVESLFAIQERTIRAGKCKWYAEIKESVQLMKNAGKHWICMKISSWKQFG
jgi:hypothetical protein